MKVGLLFPDFGSQHVGMGKELYDTSRVMQEYFEEASHCLNTNFVKLCFASSDHELARIDHAYVSLFLISSAIGAIVAEQGIKPSAVAGFGLGEFAALQFAHSLSLPDGLYFLTKYAQSYEQVLAKHSLKTIAIQNLDTRFIKQFCSHVSQGKRGIFVSAHITQYSCLVSGHAALVDEVAQLARSAHGVVESKYAESGAHSFLMYKLATGMEVYADKIDIHDAHVPVIACVDGIARTKGDLLHRALLQQIAAPVRWDRVMAHVAAWDVVIEIGPGSTLTKIIKAAWPTKQIITINGQKDIDELGLIVLAQQTDIKEYQHGSYTPRSER